MDSTNLILTDSVYSHTIFNQIYSKLWRIDPLDPFASTAPNLTYNWTVEPTIASGDIQEGLKYTFHLNANITWHDSTPFTSEDVRYSLITIHPWGTYTADKVASIYRIDTPDSYTVEIYSNSTSYVTFIQATTIPILPKHIWSSYESINFNWSPETPEDLTGTGCYKWTVHVPGQYIILDRFADWHFGVEHPDRTPCRPSYGPHLYWLIEALVIVIIIQVVILIIMLIRRSKRMESKQSEVEFPK